MLPPSVSKKSGISPINDTSGLTSPTPVSPRSPAGRITN
ncbi:MAG: hypothetical protein BWY89_00722 [Bacteroidetes bacterium ADurb.BinA012]|nr:MAG: hypothetical protein BWY89_00722 [Bacteroidetes bacterium ADurb.BinA012]